MYMYTNQNRQITIESKLKQNTSYLLCGLLLTRQYLHF